MYRTSATRGWSDERGVALVMTLLMVLAVSVLASAVTFVARTESISSLSYTSMTQVRYGAESGIHAAANHLLHSYSPPAAASATDPITSYNPNVSPVTYNGEPVVLSSDPSVPSNYPSAAAVAAFVAGARGTLNVNGAPVEYAARATLVSMRVMTDYFTQLPVTLQTWEVVGTSRTAGSGAALVEVSSVIERQAVPVFSYAAFATSPGCSALSFAGGATTGSYDSIEPLLPSGKADTDPTDGNVGTNGNLAGDGDTTTINGTLSTPRAGVGDCTTNNVTAATIEGWATVEEGLVTLPQTIKLPTPPPFPPPPGGNVSFNSSGGGGCPAGAPACTGGGGVLTIKPSSLPSPGPVVMGNVTINAGMEVTLEAGVYEFNSLTLNGGAKIIANPGPVIIKINADSTKQTPLDTAGGVVSNPSMDPTRLQFVYGGTKNIKVSGGTQTAALVYAPNASGQLTGGSEFYGAIVTNKITSTGGFDLYYDRRLRTSTLTSGNPTMTTFTWRTF